MKAPVLTAVRKELRVFRELLKSIFLQEARSRESLFWMILFPVFLLVLFGFIFGENSFRKETLAIGFDREVRQYYESDMRYIEAGSEEFENLVSVDREEGLAALREGGLYALVTLNEEKDIIILITERYKQFNFILPSILDGMKAEAYKVIFRGRELFPYTIEQFQVEGRQFSYITYLITGIIGMSLMLNCFFAIPQIIITYRNRGFLKRFVFTPLSHITFTAALIVERGIIGLFQIISLLVASAIVFGFVPNIAPLTFLIVFLAGSASFGAIGFFLAGITNSVEASAAFAQILNMLFLFTAGIFFPLEMMPPFFGVMKTFNPVYYLSSAMHAALVSGEGPAYVAGDVLVLIVFFTVFLAASLLFFRYNKKT